MCPIILSMDVLDPEIHINYNYKSKTYMYFKKVFKQINALCVQTVIVLEVRVRGV